MLLNTTTHSTSHSPTAHVSYRRFGGRRIDHAWASEGVVVRDEGIYDLPHHQRPTSARPLRAFTIGGIGSCAVGGGSLSPCTLLQRIQVSDIGAFRPHSEQAEGSAPSGPPQGKTPPPCPTTGCRRRLRRLPLPKDARRGQKSRSSTARRPSAPPRATAPATAGSSEPIPHDKNAELHLEGPSVGDSAVLTSRGSSRSTDDSRTRRSVIPPAA